MNICEHPVQVASGPATYENCGKPSVWMTDDCKAVCEEHARELMFDESEMEPCRT